MRNKLYFLTHIIFGFFILMIWSNMNLANGQCNLKIESKIEKSSNGQNSDIHLKVNQGSGTLDFYLIDLNAPQKGPVQKETRSASDLSDDFVLVFKNVPPSNYTIQAIDNRKCQVSVGGVGGILISEINRR